MAYVVSATWTAEPGKEDVVLDAIEKLTPPSREEPGNRLLPGLPGRRRAARSSACSRSTTDEDGVRRPRRLDALQGVRARAGDPRARQPRARVLRDDRLTRCVSPPSAVTPTSRTLRRVGLVLGHGDHLRVHPFAAGTDLVELLAATRRAARSRGRRGRRGRRAAPRRGRAAAAGLPGRDARLPHLRGARRRHGARPRQPRPAERVVRRAGLPVHGAARGDRAVRRRRDAAGHRAARLRARDRGGRLPRRPQR